MKLKQTDIAYTAGFFDGEGAITISEPHGYIRLEVSCSQKTPEVLEWMKRLYGGGVYGVGCRQWKTFGSKGVVFLKIVLPYLIVKRFDAEEAIAIWEARKDGNLSMTLLTQREERRHGRTGKGSSTGPSVKDQRG